MSTESKVTGLVSMLFLTHRGFTDIEQESVPNGKITIKDLWPKIKNWDSIQEKMAGENDNAEYAHNTDQLRNRAKENRPKNFVLRLM